MIALSAPLYRATKTWPLGKTLFQWTEQTISLGHTVQTMAEDLAQRMTNAFLDNEALGEMPDFAELAVRTNLSGMGTRTYVCLVLNLQPGCWYRARFNWWNCDCKSSSQPCCKPGPVVSSSWPKLRKKNESLVRAAALSWSRQVRATRDADRSLHLGVADLRLYVLLDVTNDSHGR